MNKQRRKETRNVCRSARLAIASALLLGAVAARADNLKIENVTVSPRDARTATVRFDISWENSWRHEANHDAAWVFFKVRADDKSDWQPVRLVADRVVNPSGFAQKNDGTKLEFMVPAGEDGPVAAERPRGDGFLGMFVRRAVDGNGQTSARGVTAVCLGGMEE